MNNSKKTFTTFLIVFSTMLLSFWVSDAILSMLGHFIVLDRITIFIVISIAFVFALVKACSGMKVSEVMLTILLVVLLADGVGIIGFSILSANYLTALFLIPLIIVSFALIFTALSRRKPRKERRIGKAVAILVFSLVLLALVGFSIVYFHAERLITLKSIQNLHAAEKIDFHAIFSAFETGFDLNRTILVTALALSALVALVSSVRHKGKGYGTLAFLLGLFFFDGIGICYFAFATGDYLTGTFLVPLMLIAFSLVIGFIVHRVSGWTPDTKLLGKAMLAFALVFLVLFLVGIGFYYVKTNTAPDEVFLNRELTKSGIVEFGASESLGKGSLVIPTVIMLVTTLFLFIATKLSEAPYRRRDTEIPWQLLLSIEGFILSFVFIAVGFSFYGVLGPVLLGIAVGFLISAAKRKSERHTSPAFISFYVIFLLVYIGGLVHFREEVNLVVSLPSFLVSLVLGTICSVLLCWALRFLAYREKNSESIKVIAILIAIISLFMLCFFGYELRMNPPQHIEEEIVIEKEEAEEPVKETEAKTPVVDVDILEPEPECEVVVVPTAPTIVVPPTTTLVDITDLVPSVPILDVADRSIIDFIPEIPSAPEMNVADASLHDFVPRVPSAPQGVTSWGWTYEDGWDDGWSEDDWSEDDWVDDTSDEDFWADFFVSGEDELILFDGIYYMNLFINGNDYGVIEVNIVDGEPGLPVDDLKYYLDGELTLEAWSAIFDGQDQYIYLSHFEEVGVQTRFDSDNYLIYIDFDTTFMPVRSISLRSGSAFFKPRPIEGALMVEPATFVLNSRYTMNLSAASLVNIDPKRYLSFNFSMSNTMRIKDWYGTFGLYMNYIGGKLSFDFGAWTGYKDFDDQQIKLTFGNINGASSIGIKIDHNNNFKTDKNKHNSYMQELITVEKESEILVYNEGREVYRRRVTPGNYRLEDFTFFTGANTIEIHIKPIDGSEPTVIKKDILYSNGLLLPGEYDWGVSLSFGKLKMPRTPDLKLPVASFGIPWFENTMMVYNFGSAEARFYFGTGITPALSFNMAGGISNKPNARRNLNMVGDLSFEMTHANVLGTTRYNLNIKDGMDPETGKLQIPGFSGRIGHQVIFDNPYCSSLNLGVSYSSPQYVGDSNRHFISTSLGFGGRLGFLNWNVTGFSNIMTDSLEQSTYSLSLSTSMMAGSHFTLSGSMNINGYYEGSPTISGIITGSFKYDKLNVNASSDMKGFSAGSSYSVGKHAFTVSVDSDEIANKDLYTMDGSYDYSGDKFSFGVNFDIINQFKDAKLQLNFSTGSVLADGLFVFGSGIPENFLLVSQKGAIKGNEVSIASIGSSSSTVLPSMFGVSMYAGISPYANNGFTLYSTPVESFGSSVSHDISLVPRAGMQGYVLKLYSDPTYSLSGIAKTPDGKNWINGSSPVYELSINEEGNVITCITEDYMFTDETGRFIFDEMKPGYYGFDMDYNGEWILVILDIHPAENDSGKMLIFNAVEAESPYTVTSPYADSIVYAATEVMDGDDFWSMLYPEMEMEGF